ncbi:MAG TPA: flagellar hook-basal body complex protein FliE [Deltaproteobacteria bacterium]|nr:flagellar hook-basal body complex protein FliE [Deltaproteobacteria bacterium]HPJ92986.1 flagellar hook-basal body complex protein FliE [Deltaproteobacteria bacterium]HPR50443.1 flagellar hook-basal body complex protein FliE [Deltaproteobacteria bacterium]
MKINPSDFKQLGMNQVTNKEAKTPSTSFVDTLTDAVRVTNEQVMESEKASVELAEGRSGNIHEAMIAMQKADISVRLLISVTNKLIDGYKQLSQLR